MASQHTRLLLRSLGYPNADSFNSGNASAFRKLVFELEDKWIRAQAAGDRGSLKAQATDEWDTAFRQYLAEVDCPLVYHPRENEEDLLDWLLCLAVAYAYEDQGGSSRTSHKDATMQQGTQLAPFPDWDSVETRQSVQSLLSKLQLNTPSASMIEQLLAAKAILADQVVAAAEDSSLGKQTRASAQRLSALDAYRSSLGFTTGDEKVDAAATLLRMLFIRDLRTLQTHIDDAIVEVQEFTQNPRSNAKLGVVGR